MPTSLTLQQKTFFETFGYLVIPGALAADIAWIAEEYDAIYRAQAAQVTPIGAPLADGSYWASTINHLFVAMSPRLSTLIEDERIVGICEGLLGAGYAICGGDGSIFHGNTGWHSDGWGGLPDEVRHIKISCYLEPLTRLTGALRIIPGSHRTGDGYSADLHQRLSDPMNSFGLPFEDLPCVACETRPGDIVVFDWRTKHASFGGASRRRLMCLNVHGPLTSERQRELALESWRSLLERRPDADWYPGFIESSPPERLKHLAVNVELLARARRERQAAPASV